MATRRTTTTKAQMAVSSSSTAGDPPSTKSQTSSPTAQGSPFLPTALEALLLAIYPSTLFLGSLYSTLQPASQKATYSHVLQSYDPRDAPSYFAKKSNVFNIYFVKVGWLWVTLAFLLLVFSQSSLGPPLRPQITKRRLQAILRYAVLTSTWFAVTQWFFGPAIIDRSFRWTGGKCQPVMDEGTEDLAAKAERGDFKEVFTHAACKAIGGQWRGGHDISGHVFLLILGSAMLWLELLPVLLRNDGLRETRRIIMPDGMVKRATIESDVLASDTHSSKEVGVGAFAALGVAGLSWWMLLMTAAYFHTWFEKVTGLLVAFTAIYTVYFLPRALPIWRQVIGMPGI